MIRFGMLAKLVAAMWLAIYPDHFRVTFPANYENASIVIVIKSDTNGKPFFEYDEIEIPEDDTSQMDIPRHTLPHGGYVVAAQLMRWINGRLEIVEETDPVTILVD